MDTIKVIIADLGVAYIERSIIMRVERQNINSSIIISKDVFFSIFEKFRLKLNPIKKQAL